METIGPSVSMLTEQLLDPELGMITITSQTNPDSSSTTLQSSDRESPVSTKSTDEKNSSKGNVEKIRKTHVSATFEVQVKKEPLDDNFFEAGNSTLVEDNSTLVAGNSILVKDNSTVVAGNSTLVEDNSTLVAGNNTLVKDNSTLVAGSSTLFEDNSTLMASNRTSVEDNSILVAGNSTLVKDNSTLVAGNSTLVEDNITLVAGNSTLVKDNSTLMEGNSTVGVSDNSRMTGNVNKVDAEQIDAKKLLNQQLSHELQKFSIQHTKPIRPGTIIIPMSNLRKITNQNMIQIQRNPRQRASKLIPFQKLQTVSTTDSEGKQVLKIIPSSTQNAKKIIPVGKRDMTVVPKVPTVEPKVYNQSTNTVSLSKQGSLPMVKYPTRNSATVNKDPQVVRVYPKSLSSLVKVIKVKEEPVIVKQKVMKVKKECENISDIRKFTAKPGTIKRSGDGRYNLRRKRPIEFTSVEVMSSNEEDIDDLSNDDNLKEEHAFSVKKSRSLCNQRNTVNENGTSLSQDVTDSSSGPLQAIKEEPVSDNEEDKESEEGNGVGNSNVDHSEDREIGLNMEVETSLQMNCKHRKRRKGRFLSEKQYNKILTIMKLRKKYNQKVKNADWEMDGKALKDEAKDTDNEANNRKNVNKQLKDLEDNIIVQDESAPRIILNKTECKNSTIKSLATLPDELSLSFTSKEHGLGVFTSEDLPEDSLLGPVEGELLTFSDITLDRDLTHIWVKLKRLAAKEEKPDQKNYISTENEMTSNWCRYIRPTTSREKCTLEREIIDGNFYFKTPRRVHAGEELTYYVFGNDAEVMGMCIDTLQCKRCKITFKDPTHLAKHENIFHTWSLVMRKSQCKICQAIFNSGIELSKHCLEMHNGLGAFTCNICGKSFSFEKRLRVHIKSVHNVTGEYKCLECGNIYTNKLRISRHMNKCHSGLTYICDICGQKCATVQTLKRHKIIHTCDYKSTCDQCGKLFRDPYNLKVHMLTHTKSKPFKCTECKAAYTTKQCLQLHYRKSHGFTEETMPEISRSKE